MGLFGLFKKKDSVEKKPAEQNNISSNEMDENLPPLPDFDKTSATNETKLEEKPSPEELPKPENQTLNLDISTDGTSQNKDDLVPPPLDQEPKEEPLESSSEKPKAKETPKEESTVNPADPWESAEEIRKHNYAGEYDSSDFPSEDELKETLISDEKPEKESIKEEAKDSTEQHEEDTDKLFENLPDFSQSSVEEELTKTSPPTFDNIGDDLNYEQDLYVSKVNYVKTLSKLEDIKTHLQNLQSKTSKVTSVNTRMEKTCTSSFNLMEEIQNKLMAIESKLVVK